MKSEIIKLQEAIELPNSSIDGIWGPKTDEYLERYLNRILEKNTEKTE